MIFYLTYYALIHAPYGSISRSQSDISNILQIKGQTLLHVGEPQIVKRHWSHPFSTEMRIGKIMSMAASEFPPKAVRAIVQDVASLLKERKETVSVAETVRVIV